MNDLAQNIDEDTEVDETGVEGSDPRDTTTAEVAAIPTKEELAALCADIKAGNELVDVQPVVFNFKTAVTKNSEGEVISEVKRPALEVAIAYPNVAGIIDILEKGSTDEGKKALELLMSAINSVITAQARVVILEDPTLTAITLPMDKLSFDFIANMPKAERSGGGISKDVWDDFGKDYLITMPEATGKSIERVDKAAKLLVGKFSAVKTAIPVINMLVEQLTIYLDNTKRADEFSACVEFLIDKADKLVSTTPEELLENL